MGNFVIKPVTKILAWLIAAILVYLNLKMLLNEIIPSFANHTLLLKFFIIFMGIFFAALLMYIILFPFLSKKAKIKSIQIHSAPDLLSNLIPPAYNKIAVALDFSENDYKILSAALGQGNAQSSYVLIHIVESASAKLHGIESDDYETKKDKERMNLYLQQLTQKGIKVTAEIGFKSRVKEIVRIVKASNADMLVIGAHGHTGLKDLLYGETVNAVRHELKVALLVVTL